MLTQALVDTLWPKCEAAHPGLPASLEAAAATVLPAFAIDSDLILAHVFGQFSAESANGTRLEEDLADYTPASLMAVFGHRITQAQANQIAGNAEATGRAVYNGINGNIPGTDDGYTYRGRGLAQITGRANYKSVGAAISPILGQTIDLVADPDRVINDQSIALAAAIAVFSSCGCVAPARQDDFFGVTHALNGGYNGACARLAALGQAKAALALPPGNLPTLLWLQQSLNQLGQNPPLSEDGSWGTHTSLALIAFKTANPPLAHNDTLDPDTYAAIVAALPVA
jgi:putative chitinase